MPRFKVEVDEGGLWVTGHEDDYEGLLVVGDDTDYAEWVCVALNAHHNREQEDPSC